MMASSSAASRRWNYDVFLSFRGDDTRYNFTSHLYNALCSRNIKTFIDNDLKRGEEISTSLLRHIEESKIAVIIFSKNYASSPWCLDEIVKILECKRNHGQTVLPVFYNVDRSEVGEQIGCFGDALFELQKKYGEQLEKMERWRADLKVAASLFGWNSLDFRCEGKLVKDIAEHIANEVIAETCERHCGTAKVPIQWVSHIQRIAEWLEIGNPHVSIGSPFDLMKYPFFFFQNFLPVKDRVSDVRRCPTLTC